MENIITLIIIVITVISVINQIKTKTQPKVKKAGLITRLNNYLTDLQRQLEQQTRSRSTNEFEWDQLIEEEELVHPREDSLEDLVLLEEKEPPPPPTPARRKTDRPHQRQLHVKARPKIKDQPRRRSMRSGFSKTARHRARLRQAIVWSEILGKPVGLRD